MGETYKSAGVNKEEGYVTVQKIKKAVSETQNENVLNDIGSFGAFYQLKNYKEPILVSGTDGVGTKLLIALEVKKYNTIGIDCYAMCANDIVCHGAQPLFFLDYLACGKLDSDIASEIIMGIASACKEDQCALVGGETAEMPGMYKAGDYDVAGFCVGAVEKAAIIDGSKIEEGNKIIALASSGFHSNGYSLIRKIFIDFYEDWNGHPIYNELLIPTRLYGRTVQHLLPQFSLNGIAHITGGGVIENIPRIIPEGLCADINTKDIQTPDIMLELQKRGNISTEEMYGTFNMGVGMVLVVKPEDEMAILEELNKIHCKAYTIGTIKKDQEKIQLHF